MRSFIISLSMFMCLTMAAQAYADFDKGKAAYERNDWYQAIVNLRPAADAGDKRAMMLLAQMYHAGKGVKQDLRLAFDLYQKAAKAGDGFAMVSLAAMYSEGQAVPENKAKALEYYKKAAEVGNQVGQFVMAAGYFTGMKDGMLDKDLERAYFWTLVAANNPVSDPVLSQRTIMFLANLEDQFVKDLEVRNRLKKEALAFLKERAPNVNFPMLNTEKPVDLSSLIDRKENMEKVQAEKAAEDEKKSAKSSTSAPKETNVPDSSDVNNADLPADQTPTE